LSAQTTPETSTPPLPSKDSTGEAETPRGIDDGTIPISHDADDEEGYNGDGDTTLPLDDDDSDSDEGLTMMKRKPRKKLESTTMARRGTNASTETAKKVVMDS
jgi:[calcium/calmodulin-dependent protein kinase] kinase